MAVKVDRHRPPPPRRPRAPYLIYASDDTGDIVLTYFKARQDYLEKLLPVGAVRYISGTAAIYDGMLQMVHPDRVVSEADLAKLPLVEPVYPLTEGLGLNQVRRAAESAVARIPVLPEWQDPSWRARERFPDFGEALRILHRPAEPTDVCRRDWPGRGSPMTSSWPDRSRSRWCARICAGPPAAPRPAPGICARS